MKKIIKFTFLFALFIGFSSFTLKSDIAKKRYKVLVQMKNYTGEGAYLVVSVLNSEGKYVRTLQVMGDDSEWFPDLESWWEFQEGKDLDTIDAVSGETLAGGERSTFTINIDESWMNKGYKLRFETAVEEVDYHVADVEIPLTTSALKTKPQGKGFIRYVRLLPL